MSASAIERPDIKRLRIAKVVSNIGRPKAKIGMATATTAVPFRAPSTDADANRKPSSNEPASPHKYSSRIKVMW